MSKKIGLFYMIFQKKHEILWFVRQIFVILHRFLEHISCNGELRQHIIHLI